jgi:hypothetical protein
MKNLCLLFISIHVAHAKPTVLVTVKIDPGDRSFRDQIAYELRQAGDPNPDPEKWLAVAVASALREVLNIFDFKTQGDNQSADELSVVFRSQLHDTPWPNAPLVVEIGHRGGPEKTHEFPVLADPIHYPHDLTTRTDWLRTSVQTLLTRWTEDMGPVFSSVRFRRQLELEQHSKVLASTLTYDELALQPTPRGAKIMFEAYVPESSNNRVRFFPCWKDDAGQIISTAVAAGVADETARNSSCGPNRPQSIPKPKTWSMVRVGNFWR